MGQPYSTTFDELLGQGHAIDAVYAQGSVAAQLFVNAEKYLAR